MIRAGIWKPRTRPDSFEGVGKDALPWLVNAAKAVNKPTCVEVATPEHVEACLQAGVDVLWVGARTTVNPFAVQELADALHGVPIPVMVKNPVNPDLELWIGALERLNKAGIKKLAAIHRGFSTYEKTLYRNRPSWEIPIDLKRRLPDLPMICDPSHICGRRDTLLQVAQTAMDLQFDGLMLESHRDPDAAWSDAKQQVTPENLKHLLDQLVLRSAGPISEEAHQHLASLRSRIDRIDNFILELLSERMGISSEIGEYKSLHNIAIYQPERWKEIVDRCLALGRSNGLTDEFILKLFQQVHHESIYHQSVAMKK
jgi:chorismate mutase